MAPKRYYRVVLVPGSPRETADLKISIASWY